jgi:hypothetical protein
MVCPSVSPRLAGQSQYAYFPAPMRISSCFMCLWAGAAAPLIGQRAADGATAGRLEIVAAPAPLPIDVDGVLDDSVWQVTAPVTGFVQSEPDEGRPATERTEVWVASDATTLYVAAHLYDSRPDALVVNDIRKDFRTDNQDTFEVIFDTFADRRNGYVFVTNPAGARADEQVANEGRETNSSWDAPWVARTRRVVDGGDGHSLPRAPLGRRVARCLGRQLQSPSPAPQRGGLLGPGAPGLRPDPPVAGG